MNGSTTETLMAAATTAAAVTTTATANATKTATIVIKIVFNKRCDTAREVDDRSQRMEKCLLRIAYIPHSFHITSAGATERVSALTVLSGL